MASMQTAFQTVGRRVAGRRRRFLGMPFDQADQASVLDMLRQSEPGDRFRYVVTPNVDHVIRASKNKHLIPAYEGAFLSVCDSTPVAVLSRAVGIDLPLVTGADLTTRVFQSVLEPGDTIALIAANQRLVQDLERAFPDLRFRSLVPPPGVADRPDLIQQCVDFVAGQQARFVFIGIGCPQSELIAHRLWRDPRATGTALCIGAGLEFLVHSKKRAPQWMRRAGLEWLHRLASEPRRLWRRYAYAVIPLAKLFTAELATRNKRAT